MAILALSCLAVALVLHLTWDGRWAPDLEVYRAGAQALLDGEDVYTAHPDGLGLSFTYPPFAAAVLVPTALPGLLTAKLAMSGLSVLALVCCLYVALRAAEPVWSTRGAAVAATALAAVALHLEPVRSTLGFGQVNLILMAMILVDVLGPRGRLPRGVLVGLATAVKLTPGIVIVYFLITGRVRAAMTSVITVAGTVAVGFLVAPSSSWNYWTDHLLDPDRIGMISYAGNQSMRGMIVRLVGSPDGVATFLWVLAAAVVLVVGLTLSAWAGRADDLLGLGLAGMVGLLVSPISWNHHWVWMIPLAVTLWSRCLLLRTPARVAVAVAWTALFLFGPIWWPPYRNGREFDHQGLELLTGNAYVLAGLALLAGASLMRHRNTRRAEPHLEPVLAGATH